MRKRELPYREGDFFAVPLDGGGYAIGVLARADGRGCLLGYFFGPRRSELPGAEGVCALAPEDAARVMLVGDTGLLDGRWPIVHRPERWDRGRWPVPAFARHYNRDTAFRVVYDDVTLSTLRETRCSPEDVRGLPEDAALTEAAVVFVLSKLLSAATE
jgi:hypothetical protein